MKLAVIKDVKKYILTSTIAKEEFDLVSKYAPSSLKVKDAEGNDLFAMSYAEGKHSISKFGVTFGGVSHEGKKLLVTGDLPELPDGTEGEYVADLVGAALTFINALEEIVPAKAAKIKEERTALIKDIAVS